MPLAPDATACAVCGARVPLIARTSGEEDAQAAPETPSRPVGGLSGRRAAARGGADPVSSDPLSADAPRPSAWPAPRAGDDRAAASSAGHPIAGPAADASPSVPGVPASRVTSSPVAPPTPAAPGPGAPAAAPSSPRLEAAAARDLRSAARASGGARPADVPPSVGRRVGAYAIDLALAFVAGLVGVLLGLATGVDGTLLAWALGLVVGVAQIVAEGLRGTTLGARLLGVRTVDERTGAAPGVPRAFVRQLVVALGTPVCLVGNWVVAASAAWDKGPQSRGWHDKASGTRVVRATATAGAAAAVRTAPAGAPAQVPGRAVVPPGDALYAPPPRDVRGPVPPPPWGRRRCARPRRRRTWSSRRRWRRTHRARSGPLPTCCRRRPRRAGPTVRGTQRRARRGSPSSHRPTRTWPSSSTRACGTRSRCDVARARSRSASTPGNVCGSWGAGSWAVGRAPRTARTSCTWSRCRTPRGRCRACTPSSVRTRTRATVRRSG
ncbi:RDD family protein [Cellulomonas sp. FA1]|uniref:RDD family protein n=1 Tax=Cellulomonas sp. FA1 TaxID=1346710 RepID=UPI00069A2A9B